MIEGPRFAELASHRFVAPFSTGAEFASSPLDEAARSRHIPLCERYRPHNVA
jgi:hypothetical protein